MLIAMGFPEDEVWNSECLVEIRSTINSVFDNEQEVPYTRTAPLGLVWGFKCNTLKVKPLARDLSFA